MDLTERGIPYRKVKTKIIAYKESPKDTYIKIKFQRGDKIAENKLADIEFLRQNWLPVMNHQAIDRRETAGEESPSIEPATGGDY